MRTDTTSLNSNPRTPETSQDLLAGLFVYGVSHRNTGVGTRERCAVSQIDRGAIEERTQAAGGHREQVVLSTCNRTEIYGVCEGSAPDPKLLFGALSGSGETYARHGFFMMGSDTLRHLCAVASGLESMVLGETEISGQVKLAYETARQAGRTGRVLNKIFQSALRASKEVRTATGIGGGAASIGAVCAHHARDLMTGCHRDRRVLVIGAGDMAETCVRHLYKNGFRYLSVANRSIDKAERLATEFSGRAVGLDNLASELGAADVVICSTSCPSVVVTRPLAEAALAGRNGRPLLFIDLAMPRDVSPAVDDLPGVHRYDLDHLRFTAERHQRQRQDDLGAAHHIIDKHTADVCAGLRQPFLLGDTSSNAGHTRSEKGAHHSSNPVAA